MLESLVLSYNQNLGVVDSCYLTFAVSTSVGYGDIILDYKDSWAVFLMFMLVVCYIPFVLLSALFNLVLDIYQKKQIE